jgi:hypothetical protein
MASKDRRDRDPERFSGRRGRGQGDVPGPSDDRDSWSEPGGWSGPDDFADADQGPETAHWQLERDDDPDGDGTAAWDGPMAWQDDEQGANWGEDGRGQGVGTWEQDMPPTTYGAWEAGRPGPGTYGYENSYPTAYMRPGEATGAYTEYQGLRPEPEWTGDGGRGGRRQRRRRANGPWPELVMITAVAVIVAAVILAVTSSDRTNLANSQTSSNTVVPSTASHTTNTTARPTSSVAPSSSSTLPRPTTTARPRTTAAAAGQKAKNLLVTPGVEGSLVRSWLATNPGGVNLSSKDVAGTQPGEVYYAEQPASATYWALVAFKPSATLQEESSTAAGQEKLAEFQNSVYAFSWQSGPVWTLLGEVSTGSCPGVVPAPVLKVWGMCGL